MILLCLSEKRK